jgi:hypothetical protein
MWRKGGFRGARGYKRREPGVMNKLEAEYAEYLEARKKAGEILDYGFERITLKLAKRTSYTPDFDVLLPDGLLEFHETKGFWEEDARIKIKVAAQTFPFTFFGVQKKPKKDGGGWAFERFCAWAD